MDEKSIRSYRDLGVWQEAMALAEACYRLTATFPKEELYGMSAQIRRSAVSIAANIAEGYGREATGSCIQFLKMARGSLREVETHLLIAERVGLAKREALESLLLECDKIGRMLHGLIRSLQKSDDD